MMRGLHSQTAQSLGMPQHFRYPLHCTLEILIRLTVLA
jgi:hypothetical protein